MTVGYKAPISTFVGRYLDSSATQDWFLPFRTVRATNVKIVPTLNRIYFRYGNGTVAAYSLSGFLSRVEAAEPLVFAYSPIPGDRSGNPEKFLRWDQWFNPEVCGWKTYNIDGAERFRAFDVDDQGYVYIAETIFGWGIVKDDMSSSGGKMQSMSQHVLASGERSSVNVVAVKGSKYYVIVSDASNATVYDATDRAHPVLIPGSPLPGIRSYAKTSDNGIAAITDNTGGIIINTADGFASGSQPLFKDTGGYVSLTSDGTNFFASMGNTIVVLSPNGNTYKRDSFPMGDPMTVYNIHYGDGYLTVSGNDSQGAWDTRLYSVKNLQPTIVPVSASPALGSYTSYFRNYYAAAPAGYANPPSSYMNIQDSATYKSPAGRTYLIVCAKGLGDVYELKGADSITVTNNGPAGTNNPNAPATSLTKTFYGDPIRFTASSTSTQISNVAWNMGNTEAGPTANQPTSLINSSMTYQYSNLSKTTLGAKVVTASSITDSSIRATTTAQLEMPVARFKLSRTGYLFTQPNASSPAPIVVGDTFADASDGSYESHYSSWGFDTGIVKTFPSQLMPVGGCGSHALNFQAFYGPYNTSLVTSGSTLFPVSFGNVNYSVRPFAAGLEIAASDTTSVTFRSTSGFAADTSILPLPATLVWTWQLINSAGAPIGIPATGNGTVIPPFVVPTTGLARGTQLRLTITSPTPLTGSCAGMETSVAVSAPLNPPDPVVTQTGDCNGAPCTFTASSATNVDTVADAWTYAWVVKNSAGVIDTTSYMAVNGTTSNVFNPTFIKVGTYTVNLTVTNAISAVPATPKIITVTVPATSCKTMTASAFSVSVSCSPCTYGSTATFQASNYDYLLGGYDAGCAPHTYTWSFPDGTSGTGNPIDKAVTVGGTVSVLISNGAESKTYSTTLTVGSTGGGGGGGNPGGGGGGGGTPGCGTIGSSNVSMYYSGPNGCAPGTNCKNNDTITFTASPYLYDPTCFNTMSFTWNFGDGQVGAGATTTHAYASDGTRTVTLNVTGAYGSVSKTLQLTTAGNGGGGGGGGTNPCGSMNNQNVGVTYNAASGCSESSGSSCKNNESINFDVTGYLGYNIGCGNARYSWNFNDGSPAVTTKSTTHTFSTTGSHTVGVTVTNDYQTFTRTMSLSTTDSGGSTGSCGVITPNVTLAILYSNASNTCGPMGGACAAGEVVNFTVKDYTPYNISCGNHTYDWDFGDGTPHSNSATPAHQYQTGGTYTATCMVNNGSQTAKLTQPVLVGNGSPITTPVDVDFAVTPMTGVANGYIFTATAKPDGVVTRWVWDFGDNSGTVTRNSTTPVPESHIYVNGDTRTVTLTVYNAAGQVVGTHNQKVPGTSRQRSVKRK